MKKKYYININIIYIGIHSGSILISGDITWYHNYKAQSVLIYFNKNSYKNFIHFLASKMNINEFRTFYVIKW